LDDPTLLHLPVFLKELTALFSVSRSFVLKVTLFFNFLLHSSNFYLYLLKGLEDGLQDRRTPTPSVQSYGSSGGTDLEHPNVSTPRSFHEGAHSSISVQQSIGSHGNSI